MMTKATDSPRARDAEPDPYAALLLALKAADPTAQAKFFDQAGPRVLRILVATFHQNMSQQDCEDILIEAGVKFFRGVQKFDPARGAKLETWFTTIAMNAARDEWRRRMRSRKKAQAPDWEYAPAKPELQAFFTSALEKLTEAEREYLMLWRFGRGLPADEIAEALELKAGAARKRKHGVLRKLEVLLNAKPELRAFLEQIAAPKADSTPNDDSASNEEEKYES
jgi:RNA polymerase sigma factor (sigma-70 family)